MKKIKFTFLFLFTVAIIVRELNAYSIPGVGNQYTRLLKTTKYYGSLSDVDTVQFADYTGSPVSFTSTNWELQTSRSIFFWVKHTIPTTSSVVNFLRVGSTRNNDQAISDMHLLIAYDASNALKIQAHTLVSTNGDVVNKYISVNNAGTDLAAYKWYAVFASGVQDPTTPAYSLTLWVYDPQANAALTLAQDTTLPSSFVTTVTLDTLFVDFGGDKSKSYYCQCYMQDVRYYFNVAFTALADIQLVMQPEIEVRLNLAFLETDNSIETVADISSNGQLVYRGVSQYNSTGNPGLYYLLSSNTYGEQGHTYALNQYDTISPALYLEGVFTLSFWIQFTNPAKIGATTDSTPTQIIFYKQNSVYPTNYISISVGGVSTSTVTTFVVNINGVSLTATFGSSISRTSGDWNLISTSFFRYPRNDTFVTTPFTLVSSYRLAVASNFRETLFSKSNLAAVFDDGGFSDLMRIGAGSDPTTSHLIGIIYSFQIFYGGNYQTISSSICGIRYGVNNIYDIPSNSQINSYTCLDCQLSSGAYLTSNSQCVNSCPSGTSTATINSFQICRACAFNCATCTGRYPNQCSTCTVGNLNTAGTIYCPDLTQCSSNQYFANNDCVTCSSPCNTCTSASTTCTSCVQSTFYSVPDVCRAQVCGDGIVVQGESCDDGNLINGDGCSDQCQVEIGFVCTTPSRSCTSTCGDGIRSSVEQCDDKNNNNGDGCSWNCTVEKGYYCTTPATFNPNTWDTCTACPSGCATCTSGTVCTSCTTGKYLQGASCVASCNTNQYASSGVCQACPSACSTCTSLSVCTGCNSPYFLQGGSCVVSCSVGSYPVTASRTCSTCPSGCVACSSSSVCTNCVTDGYYYDYTTTSCIQCDSTCLQCNGALATNCIACVSSSVFQSSTGKCLTLTCQSNQYINYATATCASCDSSCATCTGATTNNCSSCASGSVLLTDNSCITASTQNGFQNGTSGTYSEICGSGYRKTAQKQCDDANTVSGDGCSSNCTIETNWTCSGGGITTRDSCALTNNAQMTLTVNQTQHNFVFLNFDREMMIIVTGDLSGELIIDFASIPPLDYYWTASFYNNSQSVMIVFSFSVDIIGTTLNVTLINPDKFQDVYGNNAEPSVQISYPDTYYYSPQVQAEITRVQRANWGFQALAAFMLIPLWVAGYAHWMSSFVDYLQLIYLLIFINVTYPLNLTTFFQSWSFMHMLFLPNPFNFFPKDQLNPSRRLLSQVAPEKFDENSYTSNFLLNTGYILAAMAVAFILLALVACLNSIGQSKARWNGCTTSLRGIFQWNVIIRMWLIFFFLFALFTFLQLDRIEFNNVINGIASGLSIVSVLIVVATPFALHYLIKKWLPMSIIPYKRRKDLGVKDGNSNYNTLTDEFKGDSFFTIAYLRILVTKKIAIALILANIFASPQTQIVLLIIVMIISMLFLIFSRPFKSLFWNLRELTQDFIIFLTLCLILPFLEPNTTSSFFIRNGWDIIIILYCGIVLNILVLFILSLKGWWIIILEIRRACKKCWKWCKSLRKNKVTDAGKQKRTKIIKMTRKRKVLRRKNREDRQQEYMMADQGEPHEKYDYKMDQIKMPDQEAETIAGMNEPREHQTIIMNQNSVNNTKSAQRSTMLEMTILQHPNAEKETANINNPPAKKDEL